MFKLKAKFDVNRSILKCDYVRYSPSDITTINTPNSQSYIIIPRGDSVNGLKGSLLRLNADVLHAATNNRYKNGDEIRLVNEGPIALFSNYKLQPSSGKHIEEINHAHIVCLLYKLKRSARITDDLSIGFVCDRETRKRELTINKNKKGKYHVTNLLKEIFGFAEHQEKGTYGLGYKLTLTRNSDNAVLNKVIAINKAKFKVNSFDMYVPHCTPSLTQEKTLLDLILKKMFAEHWYIESSVSMKEVNSQNLRTFELGTQERIKIPIWIIVGFQQSDRQHEQNLNNDTFYRPPVISAQCIIGTEKYPDSAILLIYNDDDFSQGYSQIKEAFMALTKDDLLTHIQVITLFDHLMMVIILVIIYTFSI